MPKQAKRVIGVVGSAQSRQRVRTLRWWIRTLVPAAVLVFSPVDGPARDVEDAITLRADEIPSGPLSLADALARAAGGSNLGT